MKNIQTIALGVLGLAVAILYFLHFQCSNNCKSPSVKVSGNAKDIIGAGTRVAFVNTDSFFEHYKKYKALEKEVEATQKSAETNVQAKMKALEADYMKLMQQAQGGQITQQQAQAKEKEIMARKQALDKESQTVIKNISDKSQKATKDLYKTMQAYFEKNKSKYNADVVLGYQTNGNVLYYEPSMDITNEVVKDLNEE